MDILMIGFVRKIINTLDFKCKALDEFINKDDETLFLKKMNH